VPVHLGAMGESVRTVLNNRRTTLKPGDVVALNNPYNGGTHLPDVTVITPVFDADGAKSCSSSARAVTTPISVASPPAQPHPARRRWRRKASSSTISCWSMAASSAKPRSAPCWPARPTLRAAPT